MSNENWGELYCNGDKAHLIVHADSKVEKTPKPVLCSSPDGVNINLRQKVGEPNTKFIPYGSIDTPFDHPRFSSDGTFKGRW